MTGLNSNVRRDMTESEQLELIEQLHGLLHYVKSTLASRRSNIYTDNTSFDDFWDLHGGGMMFGRVSTFCGKLHKMGSIGSKYPGYPPAPDKLRVEEK